MTEAEFCDFLRDLLHLHSGDIDDNDSMSNIKIRSFEDAGLLTRNKGLIIKFDNNEFQLTVVKR